MLVEPRPFTASIWAAERERRHGRSPKCERLLNRLPAQMLKRSDSRLCIAMTSTAQLICAFLGLLTGENWSGGPEAEANV